MATAQEGNSKESNENNNMDINTEEMNEKEVEEDVYEVKKIVGISLSKVCQLYHVIYFHFMTVNI